MHDLFSGTENECIPRKFPDGIVCVCNSTYCDSIGVDVPPKGKFRSYISSEDGKRFKIEDGDFNNDTSDNEIILNLNSTKIYQTIKGFGGAFTDSAGININSLSSLTQEQLLQSYFSKTGSAYSIVRVPIGGSDFSIRPYTLDDTPNDIELLNFNLTIEDNDYKIPYIKRSLEINPQLKFFATSWSAPAWMKTNNNLRGFLGRLKKKYYQLYAEYLVKFLESYQDQGLFIWGISTGNEPTSALIPYPTINTMYWTPKDVTKWIINNLGPTIEKSNSNETIILALDDQRYLLPDWIDEMYENNNLIDKYLSGIAVHWYGDSFSNVNVIDQTHEKYSNKFILMTEACSADLSSTTSKVKLGSWERGEAYIKSIIEDMNHWVTGWIDWNLVLDKYGGPTWVGNNVDSPIIINSDYDEFFKQPMYYALAHVSKFVPPNSLKIQLDNNNTDNQIHATAFKRPDDNIIILFN
ncbi:lysosomal acid glucosylceramidase-like [Aphidius gifuensis]|uniref:lysosomal acid glucosylceramidase-like n=1 Tax=Aphidius gifuensis TaxID=684658 RepID=UPI001CDB94DC|nr:lysosomal acid glucosylceramidase-like [Aphidius gifuensis]